MQSTRVPFAFLLIVAALCQPAIAAPAPKLPGVSLDAVIDARNYESLQAAIDAVPAKGGILWLPPGTFEIKQALVLTNENVRIEGAGAATHIVNRNEQGQAALIVRPKDRATNRQVRIWRVQLGNFRVSGNPKSGDGVLAEGVNEIFVHGMSIDHHGGHGINLVDCYEDPRVNDSILTYNAKAGLNIQACHDIVVNGNQFEENQDAVRCLDSFNLCMNGNNVDDHLRHGIVIENTYGSVLSGNMIEECNGTAVILDRDCYGITISANVIAHHLAGGVHLLDAWGCSVSANTFTLVHSNSVFISSESGRNTITGNNFCNSYMGGKDKRPADGKNPMARDEGTGILVEGTADNVISGNTFSGLSTAAVVARGGCQRLMITGNLITDVNRKSPGAKPIELGDAKASIVKDNIGQ
jgi:hypothetical protein